MEVTINYNGQAVAVEVTLEVYELSSQMIILGFAAVILLGALLLMLPVSSKSGEITPFLDCLLTSTSAVCEIGRAHV